MRGCLQRRGVHIGSKPRRAQALNVWIALVERRGAWAGVRGSADSAMSGAGAAAEADIALEAAAIGGVAAHIDGLAALLAVPGASNEHASQVSWNTLLEFVRL